MTAPNAVASQSGDGSREELVVMRTRQHWRRLITPILHTALFLAVSLWIWVALSHAFLGRVLFALIVLIVLAPWYLYALKPFALWYRTRYTITTRRINVRQGLVKISEDDVYHTEVGSPHLEQSWLDQLFGSGRINLTEKMTLRFVPEVMKTKGILDRLANLARVPGITAATIAATILGHQPPNSAAVAPPEESAAPEQTPHTPPAPSPTDQTLSFVASHTVAYQVTVALGAEGHVKFVNISPGAVHMAVDAAGYYLATPAGALMALTPSRILDTRSGIGKVPAGAALDLPVAGQGGVPASGVVAVVLNVTVAEPEAKGHLAVLPAP